MFNIDLFHLDQVSGIKDGHLFDLGTSKLEVLHLPGHTPGSIGSLTQKRGVEELKDTDLAKCCAHIEQLN